MLGPAALTLAVLSVLLPAGAPPTDITPHCVTSQLTIVTGEGDGGGSHGAERLVMRNHGGTCTMQGYPAVQLLDKAGHTIGQPRQTTGGYLAGLQGPAGTQPPLVRLTRGQVASFIVEGIAAPVDNQGGPDCPNSTYVAYLIAPPGQRHPVRVPGRGQGECDPQVHPVFPGSTFRWPPPH